MAIQLEEIVETYTLNELFSFINYINYGIIVLGNSNQLVTMIRITSSKKMENCICTVFTCYERRLR